MRAIDADALMEIYMDRISLVADRYSPDSSECGILAGAMKLLDEQPTIKPERKKGKWKYGACSECGFSWADITLLHEVPYFCPNCGADMRG